MELPPFPAVTPGALDEICRRNGIVLRAVPFLLYGYRQVAPLPDERAEARILWRHLQIALWLSGRGPQPEHSWAERPLSMLIDILRFVADPPNGRWKDLVPHRVAD